MAFKDACQNAGFDDCPRIPFYSSASPQIQFNGKPVGHPIIADNARALRTTIPFVASYRLGPNMGEGLFVSTDGSGNIATLQQHTDWDRDWDLIIPGNFAGGGHTGLLFYKRSTGEGLFASTDGSGNIATLQQHTDWDRDWDLIIPGSFGDSSFTDLLFYRE